MTSEQKLHYIKHSSEIAKLAKAMDSKDGTTILAHLIEMLMLVTAEEQV